MGPAVRSCLALDAAGTPHVSYSRNAGSDLRYGRRTGGSWVIGSLDGTGLFGLYDSLALDGGGRPGIAYYEGVDHDLRYTWAGPPTEPIACTWDWGDGGAGLGVTATHTYAQPGAFTVFLTATNCVTASASRMHTLTVLCPPVLGLSLSWEPLTPTAGQPVTLTATATSTLPLTYTWDLGDGGGAVGPVVTHSYALGTYTVTVTASNSCALERRLAVLTVAAVPWRAYLPLVFKE
jgi:hypothetical protein